MSFHLCRWLPGVIWAKFGGYHLISKVAISLFQDIAGHIFKGFRCRLRDGTGWLLFIINVSLISHKLLGKKCGNANLWNHLEILECDACSRFVPTQPGFGDCTSDEVSAHFTEKCLIWNNQPVPFILFPQQNSIETPPPTFAVPACKVS